MRTENIRLKTTTLLLLVLWASTSFCVEQKNKSKLDLKDEMSTETKDHQTRRRRVRHVPIEVLKYYIMLLDKIKEGNLPPWEKPLDKNNPAQKFIDSVEDYLHNTNHTESENLDIQSIVATTVAADYTRVTREIKHQSKKRKKHPITSTHKPKSLHKHHNATAKKRYHQNHSTKSKSHRGEHLAKSTWTEISLKPSSTRKTYSRVEQTSASVYPTEPINTYTTPTKRKHKKHSTKTKKNDEKSVDIFADVYPTKLITKTVHKKFIKHTSSKYATARSTPSTDTRVYKSVNINKTKNAKRKNGTQLYTVTTKHKHNTNRSFFYTNFTKSDSKTEKGFKRELNSTTKTPLSNRTKTSNVKRVNTVTNKMLTNRTMNSNTTRTIITNLTKASQADASKTVVQVKAVNISQRTLDFENNTVIKDQNIQNNQSDNSTYNSGMISTYNSRDVSTYNSGTVPTQNRGNVSTYDSGMASTYNSGIVPTHNSRNVSTSNNSFNVTRANKSRVDKSQYNTKQTTTDFLNHTRYVSNSSSHISVKQQSKTQANNSDVGVLFNDINHTPLQALKTFSFNSSEYYINNHSDIKVYLDNYNKTKNTKSVLVNTTAVSLNTTNNRRILQNVTDLETNITIVKNVLQNTTMTNNKRNGQDTSTSVLSRNLNATKSLKTNNDVIESLNNQSNLKYIVLNTTSVPLQSNDTNLNTSVRAAKPAHNFVDSDKNLLNTSVNKPSTNFSDTESFTFDLGAEFVHNVLNSTHENKEATSPTHNSQITLTPKTVLPTEITLASASLANKSFVSNVSTAHNSTKRNGVKYLQNDEDNAIKASTLQERFPTYFAVKNEDNETSLAVESTKTTSTDQKKTKKLSSSTLLSSERSEYYTESSSSWFVPTQPITLATPKTKTVTTAKTMVTITTTALTNASTPTKAILSSRAKLKLHSDAVSPTFSKSSTQNKLLKAFTTSNASLSTNVKKKKNNSAMVLPNAVPTPAYVLKKTKEKLTLITTKSPQKNATEHGAKNTSNYQTKGSLTTSHHKHRSSNLPLTNPHATVSSNSFTTAVDSKLQYFENSQGEVETEASYPVGLPFANTNIPTRIPGVKSKAFSQSQTETKVKTSRVTTSIIDKLIKTIKPSWSDLGDSHRKTNASKDNNANVILQTEITGSYVNPHKITTPNDQRNEGAEKMKQRKTELNSLETTKSASTNEVHRVSSTISTTKEFESNRKSQLKYTTTPRTVVENSELKPKTDWLKTTSEDSEINNQQTKTISIGSRPTKKSHRKYTYATASITLKPSRKHYNHHLATDLENFFATVTTEPITFKKKSDAKKSTILKPTSNGYTRSRNTSFTVLNTFEIEEERAGIQPTFSTLSFTERDFVIRSITSPENKPKTIRSTSGNSTIIATKSYSPATETPPKNTLTTKQGLKIKRETSGFYVTPTTQIHRDTSNKSKTKDTLVLPFTARSTDLDKKPIKWLEYLNTSITSQSNETLPIQRNLIRILTDNNEQNERSKVEPDVLKFLNDLIKKIGQPLVTTPSKITRNTVPEYKLNWKCRPDTTSWSTAFIIGVSRFLQSHGIKCKSNEFLQEFQLVDNKDQFFPLFRYDYTCCQISLQKSNTIDDKMIASVSTNDKRKKEGRKQSTHADLQINNY